MDLELIREDFDIFKIGIATHLFSNLRKGLEKRLGDLEGDTGKGTGRDQESLLGSVSEGDRLRH